MKTGAALGQHQGQEEHQEGGSGVGAGVGGQDVHRRDVMDDLVDRLAALEDSL